MIVNTDITNITLEPNEYCFTYTNHHISDTLFKVVFPKFMPNLSQPLNRNVYNKNILINSSTCTPIVSSNIVLQEYVTVKVSNNCDLSNVADINGNIPKGTRLTCRCMNGNIKDMQIIDSV